MSSCAWPCVVSPCFDLFLSFECLHLLSVLFTSSILVTLHVVGTAEYKNPRAHAEWRVLPRDATQPSHVCLCTCFDVFCMHVCIHANPNVRMSHGHMREREAWPDKITRLRFRRWRWFWSSLTAVSGCRWRRPPNPTHPGASICAAPTLAWKSIARAVAASPSAAVRRRVCAGSEAQLRREPPFSRRSSASRGLFASAVLSGFFNRFLEEGACWSERVLWPGRIQMTTAHVHRSHDRSHHRRRVSHSAHKRHPILEPWVVRRAGCSGPAEFSSVQVDRWCSGWFEHGSSWFGVQHERSDRSSQESRCVCALDEAVQYITHVLAWWTFIHVPLGQTSFLLFLVCAHRWRDNYWCVGTCCVEDRDKRLPATGAAAVGQHNVHVEQVSRVSGIEWQCCSTSPFGAASSRSQRWGRPWSGKSIVWSLGDPKSQHRVSCPLQPVQQVIGGSPLGCANREETSQLGMQPHGCVCVARRPFDCSRPEAQPLWDSVAPPRKASPPLLHPGEKLSIFFQ